MTLQNVKIRLRFTTSKPVLSNLSFIRPFEFTDQSDKQIFARTPYWFCESFKINSNGKTQSQRHKKSVAIVRAYTFDLFYLFDPLTKLRWCFLGKWSNQRWKRSTLRRRQQKAERSHRNEECKRSRSRLCDIFYQKGKCDDNYVSREQSRLKLKKSKI